MAIRLAVPGDAPGIAKVQVESWNTTYPGIVPKSYLDSLDVKKREKIWKQAAGNQPLYVAEQDGEIVGFAIGGENRDKDTYPEFDGELYAIYSYKHVHGQGIGRALFEHAARNLAERGYKKMIVAVLSENPTVDFYQHMGGRYLGEETITIDGVTIQESFYGYDDINKI
ncbi:N-acetyltransferase [Jeotgalicoccus coquinae]|uniref:GNAT superfamily N-acetyltransferase n=1 Tax=Jeotgalicoccus coquinae TaxID=709509 RepID=A0A6V7RTD2_9STAP|nr:GNAT family N-acetyltransferase [Jeotgalicoccus coquinae]MBB6424227.1 GNAT superfamily N-acetyltransferase [Jeotgalicoccus coquinae]GGE25465.1 N-acetyltransferase [Jeotgalicoccus coquinae]CAD2081571.1 putative acetyltransferase [Jeotgalicoccus coquinae]